MSPITSFCIFSSYNTMHWLVSDIWNEGIAVGPVLGYVYQYRLIEKNKSVGTFSIKLCGMLLFCNILRIAFYFFHPYSQALLVQSVLMITVQLFLLRICVTTMIAQGTLKAAEDGEENAEAGMFHNFWEWGSLRQYYSTIGAFTVAVIIICLVFDSMGLQIVGELIGFLSLVSESLLMLPQVIENYKQQKVKGLSHLLVGLNNVGDLMKLAFFFVNDQPLQFIVCGILQCFIDGFVIVQILYYRSKNPKVEKDQVPSSEKKQQGEEINGNPSQQHQLPPAKEYKQFEDES